MAIPDPHSGTPAGRLVEAHESSDARLTVFYFFAAGLLLVLAGGLGYRQLIQTGAYDESEKQQTERRVLLPAPRGRIFDREGRVLVDNRARFSVVLYLDELQADFNRESIRIHNNYKASGDAADVPKWQETLLIAQVSVAQSYLAKVNAILGRSEPLDPDKLKRHIKAQLLMPYTLIDDLSANEFARLLETLPVNSPLQLHTASARYYPYGSAASHVLGYVGSDDNLDAEGFPGEDLRTLRMRGTIGRDGLEKSFDSQLQGQAGGSIFRVDPSGYKVNPPLEQLLPKKGEDLRTSIDIDLQRVGEQAIGDNLGAAVALDVRTGEVLAMVSKPDYDLNEFSPHLSEAHAADIQNRGAWVNNATQGFFPPGSTFKILVSIAGLRSGRLSPTDTSVDCEGSVMIGGRRYECDKSALGTVSHGRLDLEHAIAESCDIYFYEHGINLGPDVIATEARRFRLDQPTGIELPAEGHHMVIPDPAYKKKRSGESWTAGDTANMAIGQGFVTVSPMQMACFAASVARDEISTIPRLTHDPQAPEQHSESIGLTPEQRAVVLAGMEGATQFGTAKILTTISAYSLPGVRIAGKTGTAQASKTGTAQAGQKIDIAWFICFAPIERPEIAIAITMQGDTSAFAGGINAVPVAATMLQEYFRKKGLGSHPATVAAAP